MKKNNMKVVMKIKWLALIIFASSMFFGCTTHRWFAPLAVEDADEGTILIVRASEVQQVVENWGLQNGYQYVAYRRLQGGTESTTIWSESTDQDGTHRGSNVIVYTSQVLVIGIDNPNDAPERFNVVTVSSTKTAKASSRGVGVVVGVLLLILLLSAS